MDRGPRGAVYKSTDGGLNWSLKQILSASLNPSSSIAQYRPDTTSGPLVIASYGAIWRANGFGKWSQIFPAFWPSQLNVSGHEISILTTGSGIVTLPIGEAAPPAIGSSPSSNLIYFKDFSNGSISVSTSHIWLLDKSSAWRRI